MTTLSSRPPSEKSRRPARRYLSQNEDTRSIQAGLILTLILWPLLIWILSEGLGRMSGEFKSAPQPRRPNPSFNIELAPEQFNQPKKQLPPPKFVETNPDAPENIPDKTNNFAAKNQQAAQEKPNPDGHEDHAATEGKKDFESNQIVTGRLAPPQKAPPPAPPPTKEVAQALEKEEQSRKEQNPLPGFEKREGTSTDGYGMNVAKEAKDMSAVPEKVEGTKETPLTVGKASPAQPRIDPRKPQPRVQLAQQNVRPAIFAEDKVGTQNIGLAGYDARWSNYGAYLQRMVDSVQIQFENLVQNSGVYPPTGTVVTIRFRLNSEGKISEISNVESTGGQQAASQCTTAITSRAPYGIWTDDMVAMLGDSQEFIWRFYYGTP